MSCSAFAAISGEYVLEVWHLRLFDIFRFILLHMSSAKRAVVIHETGLPIRNDAGRCAGRCPGRTVAIGQYQRDLRSECGHKPGH